MSIDYDKTERTEIDAVIEEAKAAVEPVEVQPGLYLLHNGQTVDLRDAIEKHGPAPRRKTGHPGITDVDSFIAALTKHGMPEMELWGDAKHGTITAVVNAHGEQVPGWGDHRITLDLPFTDDYQQWVAKDGGYLSQASFAEFIEDHLPSFVSPSGADMLELAQTFQAKTKVDFESSQRVKSGETQLTYREETTATAGKKGAIAIPDTFEIALQVHERGPAYRVRARFRYRIRDGALVLAYRLERLDDVVRAAFDEVVEKVETGTPYKVWHGRP